MDSLKNQVEQIKTDTEDKLKATNNKFIDVYEKLHDVKIKSEEARAALLETIDQRLSAAETNLGNRIDKLQLKLNLDINKVISKLKLCRI